MRSAFTGGTDNKATEALSLRLLTTKVPLMFVLVQYVDTCDKLGIRCQLGWRRRDANAEADRIIKHCFDDFSLDLRLSIEWPKLDLSVLVPLLEFCIFRSDLDAISASAPSPGGIRFERFEKSFGDDSLFGCPSSSNGDERFPLGASNQGSPAF